MAREIPVARRIDQDVGRFRRIVRGEVRRNLKKYVSQGELLGKVGNDAVSIPLPQIRLPRFTFGDNRQSGVGMGEGGEGDPVPGEGAPGQAGEEAGDHVLEVEVPLPELAEILGEELRLPAIKPRGREQVLSDVRRYRSIRRTGPESLRHFRRTFKTALRRQIASGTYDPARPVVIPNREDRRYRSWRVTEVPQANAAVIYMMDVSGSMGTEQKEIVRITAFWLDTWLRSQYRRIETRFIVHDAAAREVDRHDFFHLRESGGTKISSAYELCSRMIDERYSPLEWNVYPFHFSDGDNWSGGDTRHCLDLVRKRLLPRVNVFCYGQVKSAYGSGQFKVDLDAEYQGDERVLTTEIPDREGILPSLRTFLGDGPVSGTLPPEIRRLRDSIRGYAEEYGLDFNETFFEVLDHDALNEVASYGGFPTRYPHWRFGMQYEHLRKGYEYGLQKIYELVVNNDPCYAYLMRSNSLTDQKIVIAHVYGHADFFKNNLWFAPTNRKMIDQMANHGTRIRRYADRHGQEKVEHFLDDALALENLVDVHAAYRPAERRAPAAVPDSDSIDEEERRIGENLPRLPSRAGYMDRYLNPPEAMERERRRMEKDIEKKRKFPASPRRDVVGFLQEHAPLSSWQKDLLGIVRAEALYFAPQAMTKIMNEGWATFWHSTILAEKALEDDELLDYADAHSATLATRPGSLNPYKLGLELWRDIQDRWDRGRFGAEWARCEDGEKRRTWDTGAGLGRQKIFEVRRAHNDVTFIDEFLTEEFVRAKRMFVYRRGAEDAMEISTREFEQVKATLLRDLTNFGNPVVEVADANHGNRGELLLVHRWDGLDLKLDFARDTLEAVQRIWKRPVHVETKVEGRGRLLSYDGDRHSAEDRNGEGGEA